jgi:hypothetical protein
MVAYVPTCGSPTIDARLGDRFGWWCGTRWLLAIAMGVRSG